MYLHEALEIGGRGAVLDALLAQAHDRTSRLRAQLEGHAGAVFDARFSSDGNRALTAGEDGTVAVTGTITLDQETHPLRSGTVVVIPAGVPHSLEADPGEELEFIIFGTPPMAMDDERAKPQKV